MEHTEQILKWIEWETKNKAYLYDKKIIKKDYPSDVDHAHCELCWARFGSSDGDLRKGYFERESQSWICEDCFTVFRDYFRWRI